MSSILFAMSPSRILDNSGNPNTKAPANEVSQHLYLFQLYIYLQREMVIDFQNALNLGVSFHWKPPTSPSSQNVQRACDDNDDDDATSQQPLVGLMLLLVVIRVTFLLLCHNNNAVGMDGVSSSRQQQQYKCMHILNYLRRCCLRSSMRSSTRRLAPPAGRSFDKRTSKGRTRVIITEREIDYNSYTCIQLLVQVDLMGESLIWVPFSQILM